MNYSTAPWKSIFSASKERGVRNTGGFICFLPKPSHYTGQDDRYNRDLRENECNAVLIAHAPEMWELLMDIAHPKRGSESETWGIKQVSDIVAKLLSKIESGISK